MPFKTGLGTAGLKLQQGRPTTSNVVSMPFKTGLGTADGDFPLKTLRKTGFQCPLRRAWVLRFALPWEASAILKLFQCPLRRAWVLRSALYIRVKFPETVFQCPLRRAWVLRGPPSEVLDFQGVARGVSLTSVIGGLWRVGKGIFLGSIFGISVGNRGGTNLTCLNDISVGGWGASAKLRNIRRVFGSGGRGPAGRACRSRWRTAAGCIGCRLLR